VREMQAALGGKSSSRRPQKRPGKRCAMALLLLLQATEVLTDDSSNSAPRGQN